MKEKEYNYNELVQNRMRDEMVLRDVKLANEKFSVSKYSEEQILKAQEEKGKKEINELYYTEVFPLTNNILYFIYYIFSLSIIPIMYFIKDNAYLVAIMGYLLLVVLVVCTKIIDKNVRTKKFKRKKWMNALEQFSIDTFMFSYLLSSISYMLVFIDKKIFLLFYIVMWFVFIFALYYDVIKYLIKNN